MTILARFSNNSNGRRALLALKATFAGKSFWEKIIRYSENFLENCKWTEMTDITIERHTSGNREGYTSITEAAEHVHPQIPTGWTFCAKFIESFDCNNPNMLSGLAAVDNDNTGTRDEKVYVAYLISMDPVARINLRMTPKREFEAYSLQSCLVPSRRRESRSQGWNLSGIRIGISFRFNNPRRMKLSHRMLSRMVWSQKNINFPVYRKVRRLITTSKAIAARVEVEMGTYVPKFINILLLVRSRPISVRLRRTKKFRMNCTIS